MLLTDDNLTTMKILRSWHRKFQNQAITAYTS